MRNEELRTQSDGQHEPFCICHSPLFIFHSVLIPPSGRDLARGFVTVPGLLVPPSAGTPPDHVSPCQDSLPSKKTHPATSAQLGRTGLPCVNRWL